MIFWGERGATRAREMAQDLIDAPTITLCQQNRPLSCPGCLHPARPITLFYMALGFGHLLLSPALARVAYVSLPLLLTRVTGAGVSLARSTH